MSSNISRDSNKYIIKKNVPLSSTPSISNNSNALTDPNNVNLSSLSLNGVVVTSSAADLNKLNSTLGTASANLALITNSSINIGGINSISCSSLSINGKNITGIATSSGKSNSPYLNNIEEGSTYGNKIMLLDSNKSIANINDISTGAITINNTKVKNQSAKYNLSYQNIFTNLTNIKFQSLTGKNFRSVTWSPQLNLFIAVGDIYIYTSSDGINWASRTPPNTTTMWFSVCWSPELSIFVATGIGSDTNLIMYSSDGINWVSTTAPAYKEWISVCWSPSLNIFVSTSTSVSSSAIMTSPDGINWTLRTSPNTSAGYMSVCWCPELSIFVACGYAAGHAGSIITSSNGINWTITQTTTASWVSICWSPELNMFMAAGSNNTGLCISRSNNGTTWTLTNITDSKAIGGSKTIHWNPKVKQFILGMGVSYISYSYLSSDGINWNVGPATLIYLYSMCYAPAINKIVCVGVYVFNNNVMPGVACNSLDTINKNIYKQNVVSKLMYNIELTKIDSTMANTWGSMCWSPELNLFVAVSNSGTNRVMTSIDGTNWVSQSMTIASTWTAVCWSSSLMLFVAVANTASSSNSIMTSPDGVTWTTRTSPNSNPLATVCWSNDLNLFVAVSASVSTTSTIITSPDGINWTQRSAPYSANWSDIIWCSDLKIFVCVSRDYYSMSSPDGINWVGSSTPLATAYTVCWSPQLNMFITNSNLSGYMISYNGSIWINRTFPVDFNPRKILWCSEYGAFVCLGNNAALTNTLILYSFNGLDWNTTLVPNQTNTTLSLNFAASCWSPKLGIFVTASSNIIVRSSIIDNNITINLNSIVKINNYNSSNSINNKYLTKYWYGKSSVTDNTWSSLTFSEELCMIVAISSDGTTSNNIMTSVDGNNWISQTSPNTNAWTSICISNDLMLFVAVASSGTGNRVMTSSDGITWTSRTSASDDNWTSVCWSKTLNLFVAVASSGTGNRVMTSPDGVTWTSRTSASDNNWTSVCWSKTLNLFVAVASSGTGNRVMTSPDGVTWATRTSASDNNWASICWSHELNLFVAVASDGTTSNQIMTSINGIDWISRNTPVANSWTSVCWSYELKLFISVASSGTGNRIISSSDGINWYVQTSAIDNNWSCVHWCNSLSIFVAVASSGSGNRIMISNINLPTYKNAMIPDSYYQLFFKKTNYGPMYGINITTITDIYQFINNSRLGIFTAATDNWGCMRFVYNSSSTNYVDYYTTPDGNKLNINVNGGNQIFNIVNHNGSTTGLQINSILVNATANDLNKLGVTSGIASASKALIVDNNKSITGINTLSINTILLNKKLILSNSDNNNNYLTNATAGTSTALTTLITDSNTNVAGINELGTTILNINSTNVVDKTNENLNTIFSNFKNYGNYPSNVTMTSIVWASSIGMFVGVGIGTTKRNYQYPTDSINYSYNGIDWYTPKVTVCGVWKSVCWSPELNLFVAVNDGGNTFTNNRVITSSNGINWAVGYCPNSSWNSICWSSTLSLFVAVAYSGTSLVMTSSDGITWTARTSANTNPWNSVCWAGALGLFVAVAYTGTNKVMTSPDGINWTARTESVSSEWCSVCWSPELGLLTAVSRTYAVNTTTSIMTSSNGINWTTRTAPATNSWNNVCWAGGSMGLFIAVAASGSSNRIMKSSNGINWSIINTSGKDFNYLSCAYSSDLNRLLISLNESQSNLLLSSTDGTNLEYVNTCYDLGYSNIIYAESLNLYVALGITGVNSIATSTDCKKWTLGATANPGQTCNDMAWSPTLGIFVILGTTTINYSYNGINWTAINNPGGVQWNSVLWCSTLNTFIAVTRYRTTSNLMKSTDGINWTITSPYTGSGFNTICWSPTLSLFIISTDNATNRIITSADCNTWSPATKQPTIFGNYTQWISGMNIFINAASSTYSLSYDGINWSTYTFSYVNNGTTYSSISGLTKMDYIPSLKILLACGSPEIGGINPYIYYSYDGITWNPLTMTYLFDFYKSVTYFSQSNIIIVTGSGSSNPGCPFLTLDLNEYNIRKNTIYNLDNLYKQSLPHNKQILDSLVFNDVNLQSSIGGGNCICWSAKANYLVSISGNATTNCISVSRNGIDWSNTITSPNLTNWTSVCWSPELALFLAVGTHSTITNTIMRSSDALTWTAVTFSSSVQFSSVCWSSELLLFVAVSNNMLQINGTVGSVWISPTGTNWQSVASLPNTNLWNSVCWCKYLGMFVVVGGSGTGNRVMTSLDGITWTARTTPSDNNWTSVCYNSYSNTVIAVANSTGASDNNRIMYSTDGINWTAITGPIYNDNSCSWDSICWSPELNAYVATSKDGTYSYMYSINGINWTVPNIINSSSRNYKSICWSSELNMFISSGSNYLLTSTPSMPLYCSENTIYIDQKTGNVGLGGNKTPTFQLHLSSDSAAKPSTSTWTVSSDERLKENIQNADLDLCYSNIKNLRLTKYTWKDDVYTTDEVADRSKLGWIAQEVETVFPKAVEKHNMHGYEDCRTLNTDQIIASMYGCLQKIMNIYDNQTNELVNLEENISKIQNTIDDLTKQ